MGNTLVGIRCTSERFGDWLDRALAAHWTTESAPAIYSLVVADGTGDGGRSGRQFHILYRYTAPLLKTLHLPTLIRGLFAELDSLTFGQRDDALFLHAGLVASNGSLALGPGSMSAYLTRLGRRVEREGLRMSASRYTAVDPASGEVIPVPSQLDLSSRAVGRLETLVPADRPDDRLGLVLDAPARVDAVFDYSGGEPLEQMSRALVVSRLAGKSLNLPKLGMSALEGLARLVQGTPCVGIGRPDPRTMLELVSSVLRRA